MKATVRAVLAGTIADYDTPDYQPTSENDTESIKKYFGHRPAVEQFDAFLVKVGDGDYDDVLGFHGTVPNLGKAVYRITRTYTAETKTKPRKSKRSTHSQMSLGGIRG